MAFGYEHRICPDCRKLCKCFVREVLEADRIHFCDEYTLYCLTCRRIVSQEKIDKGSYVSSVKETRCPFCREMSKNHERTPKELVSSPAAS